MENGNGTKDWIWAFKVYSHPRVLGMMFLGFSAGLPYMLIFGNLATWLTDIRVPIFIVGFFSLLTVTYAIKVFWAPVIDVIHLPLLTRWLGHRRSWMLLSQIGIGAGLLGLSSLDPHQNLWLLAWFGLLTAFSAATQDICVDAYRIEAVSSDYQAAMASTYMFGYRFAIVVSGAGVLMISEFSSWNYAYFLMACLMLVGVITTLIIDEPINRMARKSMPVELVDSHLASFSTRVRDALRLIIWAFTAVFLLVVAAIAVIFPVLIPLILWAVYKYRHLEIKKVVYKWYLGTVVGPIVDFVYRFGFRLAMLILALVMIYRISDLFMAFMAHSLYIVVGFSKFEIAIYTKVFGVVMTLLGTFAGGIMVMRYGVMRILLLGAVMVAATNLLFTALALTGKSVPMLIALIIGDNVSAGVATAAFVAYLSALVNKQYTATQYALFSSLMLLLGKFTQGFSGQITHAFGFPMFFTIAALLGLPTILLILYLIRLKHEPRPPEELEERAKPAAAVEKPKGGGLRMAAAYSIIPLLIVGLAVLVLFERGVFQFNTPDERQYPYRGIVVAADKKIKWDKFSTYRWDKDKSKPFGFVYFEVTKGAVQQLPAKERAKHKARMQKFIENWQQAAQYKMSRGVIHTFSLCDSAESQYKTIKQYLPREPGTLAPVIEVQLVGNCPVNRQPSNQAIRKALKELVQRVESDYGKKPVLMGTAKAYRVLVSNNLNDYRYWIKSVVKKPGTAGKFAWDLWQYSSRGLVEGLSGYAGLVAFKGSEDKFYEEYR